MKTITKMFDLYEFHELSEEAKNKAVNKYIEFEIEMMDENSPYYHCALEMEKMRTPWFIGECIYEHHKENIITSLETYLFFKDGKTIPNDYYPEGR